MEVGLCPPPGALRESKRGCSVLEALCPRPLTPLPAFLPVKPGPTLPTPVFCCPLTAASAICSCPGARATAEPTSSAPGSETPEQVKQSSPSTPDFWNPRRARSEYPGSQAPLPLVHPRIVGSHCPPQCLQRSDEPGTVAPPSASAGSVAPAPAPALPAPCWAPLRIPTQEL